MTSSALERFWAKVQKTSSCWIWTGSTDGGGYGKLSFRGRTQKASRVAWQLFRGPLRPTEWILHKCDNRLCVNPRHLFKGNRARNVQDAVQKNRLGSQKLTVEKVLQLRKLAKNPTYDSLTLSHLFKVSRAQINNIVARRSWRHVP